MFGPRVRDSNFPSVRWKNDAMLDQATFVVQWYSTPNCFFLIDFPQSQIIFAGLRVNTLMRLKPITDRGHASLQILEMFELGLR